MRRVPGWYRIGFILVLGVSFWYPAQASEAGGGAEIEARASAQGEQTARVLALARIGSWSLKAGAESVAGAQAPLRHAALAAAGLVLDEWELAVETRLAPPQAGAGGASLELAARHDLEGAAVGFALAGRSSSWIACPGCAAQELRGLGAVAELEAELPWSLKASVRGAAYWVELQGVPAPTPATRGRAATAGYAPGPWDRFGASTLDWPERWELGLSAARPLGPVTLALGGSLGAPPADGALCTRATARVEAALGPATAAIAGGLAHLTPSGQLLAEVAFTLGLRLGGVP